MMLQGQIESKSSTSVSMMSLSGVPKKASKHVELGAPTRRVFQHGVPRWSTRHAVLENLAVEVRPRKRPKIANKHVVLQDYVSNQALLSIKERLVTL